MKSISPLFHILAFPPRTDRKMWSHATCGMSMQNDAPPIELHLFSPVETKSHIELLTVIAHFHLTGDYLNLGHTVHFGRPWLPDSKCEFGLVSLPYLDGPNLEWLQTTDRNTRFLWLVPITQAEVEFKKRHGLDALESRFEITSFNYLDPRRASAV